MYYDYRSVQILNNTRLLEAEKLRQTSGANYGPVANKSPNHSSVLVRLGRLLSVLGTVFVAAIYLS